MRASYALLALFLGLIGFAAIEIGGTLAGVITAMTPSAVLDAAAYGLGTLLLAVVFAPVFRRARGLGVAGTVLAFLLLYAPLVGAIAAVFELTAAGGWDASSLVRGAFITIPGNLIVTYVVELWFVAVPLGVVSALLLWRQVSAGTRRSPERVPTSTRAPR